MIGTGLHQLSNTVKRAERRVYYELQYYLRKAAFHIRSAAKIDRMRIFEKQVERCFLDQPLHVFLNRSLTEIDQAIEADAALKTRIVSEATLVMQHTWLILNEHRSDMFDAKSGHYRWTEDFFTGYRYPNCFYMDARKSKTLPGTDIKIPWETSRMHFLFALALSYRATKDETYAKRIIEIICDFCACCPYDTGVNWNVSMEVGIRIANILLACELIQDAASFDLTFRKTLAALSCAHMKHIRKNPENENDAGNHFLANLLGLAAVCTAFPYLPGAEACRCYSEKALHREICRQILPDGGHFEGSVSYHRLVGELIGFSVIALQKRGLILSDAETERLRRMGDFTDSLCMENGLVPQLGDNDSGRVFQLAPEDTRDHGSFLNLIRYLTDGYFVYPRSQDGFFCFYTDDVQSVCEKDNAGMAEFPNFGLLRYRESGMYLTVSGMTPDRYGKRGHSHNDILSFTLAFGKDEFITDPGSGEYTGNVKARNRFRSVNSHSAVSVDNSEQRLFPATHNAFQWDSSVIASLQASDNGNGDLVFIGECSYYNYDRSKIVQKRNVKIGRDAVRIEDEICGMERECTMMLPVFPDCCVTLEEDSVMVQGKYHSIRVTGSWDFELVSSYFAVQYKKTIPCEYIRCSSKSKDNVLVIEVLT